MDITSSVPAPLAMEMRVIPVRESGRTLVLASDCKPAAEAQEKLAFILNREVRFVIRSRSWIDAQLELLYRSAAEQKVNSAEDEGVTWFWPACHYLDGDKLIVKVSGWEGMEHWTGAQEFPLDHPDRAFWNWLITVDHYGKGLLDEREIPKIRRIWNHFRQRKDVRDNSINSDDGSNGS
ncbi:MAG: hypothetical protein KDA78_05285 [Planctomycetaceae bacterium]|nr:hypothetical protein [Planctomycetaceae bacterium]